MIKKFGSLDLAVNDVVLVRFRSRSSDGIPEGLRSVNRPMESELIKKRMAELKTTDEKRTRGYQVIRDAHRTQVALLRTGLANNGLSLTDAHKFFDSNKGYFVGSLAFRKLREGEEPFELPEDAKEALRILAVQNVWIGHVWQNPNWTAAIELLGRQEGNPLHSLVTRNGHVVALPTEKKIEEQEEDARISQDLYEEFVQMGELVG